jgi:hypothetical protein
VLASLRTRVAGASLPSSRRASRKVSGKTDICETFFNQESILHPPKVDHTSPEEGTRKKTQGLRPLQRRQADQRRRLRITSCVKRKLCDHKVDTVLDGTNPNSLVTRYVEFYLCTKDTLLQASFQVGSRLALARAPPS